MTKYKNMNYERYLLKFSRHSNKFDNIELLISITSRISEQKLKAKYTD